MRRVMLTVPPAPGNQAEAELRQSEACVRRCDCTRPQNAAISSPLPSTWPCTSARHALTRAGAVSSSSTSAGLCRVRARCALAGSAKRAELGEIAAAAEGWAVAGQAPRSVTDGSTRATSSASEQRGAGVGGERVVPCGRLNRTCRVSSSTVRPQRDRDLRNLRGSPFGEPADEFRTRLQRRVCQRLGDDACERRRGGVDGAQHVVADAPRRAAIGHTAPLARRECRTPTRR